MISTARQMVTTETSTEGYARHQQEERNNARPCWDAFLFYTISLTVVSTLFV